MTPEEAMVINQRKMFDAAELFRQYLEVKNFTPAESFAILETIRAGIIEKILFESWKRLGRDPIEPFRNAGST